MNNSIRKIRSFICSSDSNKRICSSFFLALTIGLLVFCWSGIIYAQEIIVDGPADMGNGYSESGSWHNSGANNEYGGQSRYSNKSGSTATWTPTITTTGTYKVYHWSSNKNYDRDEAAPFTINHANGSITFSVNQKVQNGAFYQLGSDSYCFKAGTTSNVVLTRHSGGSHGTSTSADAIKFTLDTAGPCGTYTITSSVNGIGGTIAPNGPTEVTVGTDQAYAITANPGYSVDDVLVDGVSVGAVTAYTFTSVDADHTIVVSFTPMFHINASAGTGGSITPSGDIYVTSGDNQVFNINKDPGYVIDDVLVDGVSVGAVTTYTFATVNADHTISAGFRDAVHTITATSESNGHISPTGAVSVNDMSSQSFTMSADAGYTILDVEVDGVSVGAVTNYDFTNVTRDHTIKVYIRPIYTINATTGTGGSINPSGAVSVTSGTDQAFNIISDSGFLISAVLVDGVAQPDAVSQASYTFTFSAVNADHTISASFDTGYIIVPTASSGGSITPGAPQEKAPGDDQTFSISPDVCYDTVDVLVDGVSVGAVTSYLFSNISADHTIAASFAARGDLNILSESAVHSTILPVGVFTVPCGNQQIFTVSYDLALKDLYIRVNENAYPIIEDGIFSGTYCVSTGTPNECKYTIYNVEEDYNVKLTETFEIADYPLDIQTRPGPPNIMFVLDDSGSMDWEFMTSESGGRFNGEYYIFGDPGDNAYSYGIMDSSQKAMWKSQWCEYNKMYYDPSVDYAHWPDRTDALVPPAATLSHPLLTDSMQLQDTFLTIDGVTIPRAHYYVYSSEDDKPYLVLIDYASTSIKYYQVDSISGSGSTEKAAGLAGTASPPDSVMSSHTYAEEMQNFANWFSFYRRRELAATAAVSTVMNQLSNTYMGIRTINSSSSYGIQQELTPVRVLYLDANNNLVYEDNAANLLTTLYGLDISAKGTPLRTGLQKVGQYFDRTDTSHDGDLSGNPWFDKELGGECQQSFAIVMTDGFWNGSSPYIGNEDNGEGQPYEDSWSNTLADVAMYYYQNHDLVNDATLADHVPGSATWQHLTTYGVSFGVKGTLETAQPIEDYTIVPGCISGCNYPVWPDPNSGDDQRKIDDLWHAAVNGRGKYVNASNPMQLVDALLDVIGDIVAQDGSAASVSVNGDELYMSVGSTIRMYQTRYKTPLWVGDIMSYGINDDGTVETSVPVWQASVKLDTALSEGASVSSRLIATLKDDPSGPSGISFKTVTDLTAIQQAYFDDGDASTTAQQIMDYIRGSNAKESITDFRKREDRLGDIVNSTAVHMGGYLYVGANDGMLHAFSAESGEETFAYVPNLVMPNLKYLKEQNYSNNHRFYVDNSPYAKEMGNKTFLVGGLGKGGKGYYCLDITNPSEGGDPEQFKFDTLTQAELAAMVKWEYPQADTPTTDDTDDLGYSFSRAYIVDSNADDSTHGINYGDSDLEGYVVIFGNGYSSDNGNAVLYFLDPDSGDLIKKINVGGSPGNGLSTPVPIDVNNDYKIDYIYAGDLLGNLWKFDVTDSNPDNWQVAYCDDGNDADHCKNSTMPQPLFTTKTNQPITVKPDVLKHNKKDGYIVIFGTGRFLDDLDWLDTSVQSIYGIWDYGDDDDDTEYLGSFNSDNTLSNFNGTLLQQTTIYEQMATQNEKGDTISAYIRVLSQNEADWTTVADTNSTPATDAWEDPTVHAGWFYDLPLTGERVGVNPLIRDNKAIVISFVLEDDRCTGGAESLIHEMNPYTGGRLDYATFDINEDNAIGEGDYILFDTDGDGTPDRTAPTATKRPGRLQPPAILRKDDGTEVKYFSSSNASIQVVREKAEQRGIYYWKEN